MRRKLMGGLLAGCLMLAAADVNAAVLVDSAASQENSGNDALAGFNEWAGQAFQPTNSNVAGARIGITLRAGESPNGFVFELELRSTVTGQAISGATGSTTTIMSDPQIMNSDDFFEVVFSNPVAVTANDTYFWAFRETATPSNVNPRGFYAGDMPGSYPGGNAYTQMGTSSPLSFNGSGPNRPDLDFQFQTLFDDSVTAVPEPSSFLLLTASTAVIGIRRRRR